MRIKLYLLCLFTLTALADATADTTDKETGRREYTMTSPLIYEDIWDLPPYTFLNKEGEPVGFNIDLVKTILRKLDIPYIIRLKPTAIAYKDLQEGKSDLMLGMMSQGYAKYGKYGRSVVSLFTHGIVHPKGLNPNIETLNDLKGHKVIVLRNSFSHNSLLAEGLERYAIPVDDMDEAIQKVASRDSGLILWNSLSLRHTLRRYKLTNLEITPIHMPNGEYHFMSNDRALLTLIDSVYEELIINDGLQTIRNRWFYPDQKTSGIPVFVWHIALILAIIIMFLFIYNRIYFIREKKVNRDITNMGNRLALYLQAGEIRMWTFDVKRNMFITFTLEGDYADEFSEMGFSVFFNPDDYKEMCKAVHDVSDGRAEKKSVLVKCHKPLEQSKYQYFDVCVSVLRRENGYPSLLLGTQQNVTHERQKNIDAKNLQLKFHYIFNTVNVDMALYDSNGKLIDINAKACQTLGMKESLMKRGISIQKVLPGIDMNKPEMVYASSILKRRKTDEEGRRTSIMPDDTLFYELMVLPMYHNGKLLGFFTTGRDVTDFANNIHKEREKTKLIRKATEKQYEYMKSISYALETSHIWLLNYYPDKRLAEITYDLHKPKLQLSQLRCMELINDNDRHEAISLVKKMDRRKVKAFYTKFKTVFHDERGKDMYVQVNGVPIYDEDGNVAYYFGLCRNVSKMEEIGRELKYEMEKAREAETVKNAFMKNMSYEIRTPLNAVVGFAELFDMEHSPEDEIVFMTEIKKNSNLLLRLVNDILLLSRIDANMEEINKTDVDFAEVFGAHCMIGWNTELNQNVKTVIESPYEHLVVNIDESQIGKIIEILTANASHFTSHGMIRGRYEYHNDRLVVTIEDTGIGMSKTTLKNIFENKDLYEDIDNCYVRLGMMICKRLCERMGG
ncbi:MAG: PAS domain S-box protein, partial [Prevotella sp.]